MLYTLPEQREEGNGGTRKLCYLVYLLDDICYIRYLSSERRGTAGHGSEKRVTNA